MAGIDERSSEEVKRLIVALLVSEKFPYNIPLSRLEYCYREAESERIPYKALGYSSLVDFLKTIPQIQLVPRDGNHVINFLGTEKTKHVSELIAKQKNTQKPIFSRSRSSCRRRTPGCLPSGYVQRSHSAINPPRPLFQQDYYSRLPIDILDVINRSPSGISKSTIVQKIRQSRAGFFDLQCLDSLLNRLGDRVIIKDNMLHPSTGMKNNGQVNYQSHHVDWNPDGNVLPKKPVVIGVDIDGNNDSSDVSETSRQTNDVNKQLAVINNSEIHVQNNGDDLKEPSVFDPKVREAVDNIVNDRTKFRLEKLIQNHPDGIWCAELGKFYREEYKIDLEWENLGFNSLSDLVLHLPDIFYCIQPVPSGDFRLYDAKRKDQNVGEMMKKPTLASVYQVYQDPEDDVGPLPRERLPPETINHLIPDDVVRIGETIGQVPISSFDQKEKGYEEVVVCDAFTPSFFWIHLRRKMPKLESLMDKLEHFYEERGNEYCVPIILLEKGLHIACKFYGKWHRGIIRAVDPEANTTVLFYDYGTVHKYPASEIHFLHNSFSALPAQAIPCGLYNIKPPEDSPTRDPDGKPRWSIETSRLFVQRVHDKALIAVCGKVCENNSLLLDLTDTLTDDDVNIGDWLVQSKLAVYGSTVSIKPENYPYKHYLICTGKFPQFSRKTCPSVVTAASIDVSKLPNDSKRVVSRISELRKFLNKDTNKKLPKCPTCGETIEKSSEEKFPEVLQEEIPQLNAAPTNYPNHVNESFNDDLPKLSGFALKSIENWIETSFMISTADHDKGSFSERDEKGLTPSNISVRVKEELIEENSWKLSAKVKKTYKVEQDALKIIPKVPKRTFKIIDDDLDALSENDTVVKPKRMNLNTGFVDWDFSLVIDEPPKPKGLEHIGIMKNIPQPRRNIVETKEPFGIVKDSSLEVIKGAQGDGMIIPTIKQVLKKRKNCEKYVRVVMIRGDSSSDKINELNGNDDHVFEGIIEELQGKSNVNDDKIEKMSLGTECEEEESEIDEEREENQSSKSTNSTLQIECDPMVDEKTLHQEIMPPKEETPKERVLIEELSSSENDEIKKVSVHTEFLKNSPRLLQQIFDSNHVYKSTELDSDDELSEGDKEENFNEGIEEGIVNNPLNDHDFAEMMEMVKNKEKSTIEIPPNLPYEIPILEESDLSFDDDEEFDVCMSYYPELVDDVINGVGNGRELMINGNHDGGDVDSGDNPELMNLREIISESKKETNEDDDVEEVFTTSESERSIGVVVDPNDMSNYVEDYDYEVDQKNVENQVSQEDESAREEDIRINRKLGAFLELVQSRLYERGLQLKATNEALLKLSAKESTINCQLLHELNKQILEDTEKKFCEISSTNVYDVFFPDECFISDDDSMLLLPSVDTNNTLRYEYDRVSQDIDTHDINTENNELIAANSIFMNDEDNGTLELCPEIDIDGQESFISDKKCTGYSVWDLSDKNPFKNDILAAATSPYPDIPLELPSRIPPRTKRPSKSNNHSNENHSEGHDQSDDSSVNREYKEVSKPPRHAPLQFPPRKSKNFFKSTALHLSESIAKIDKNVTEEAKLPDYLLIDLEKYPVLIFLKDDNGWITIDQFRVTFTNYSDNSFIIEVLIERKLESCIRVVKKKNDPEFFDLIDRKVNSFRKECSSFYLIPVNLLLKMLKVLDLVSQEDIKRGVEDKGSQHPILRECYKLLTSYNESVGDYYLTH